MPHFARKTREFHPVQAEEIARAFLDEGVDYLSSFRVEYEKRHAPPLRWASDAALQKSRGNGSAEG
jgi:hypothetical protein